MLKFLHREVNLNLRWMHVDCASDSNDQGTAVNLNMRSPLMVFVGCTHSGTESDGSSTLRNLPCWLAKKTSEANGGNVSLLVWILSLDNLMIFWGGVVSGCLRSFPPWPAQSLPFLVKLLGSNIKHLMSKAHDAQIWCTVNLRYISIYFHCCPIHLQIYKEHLPCSGCGGHFPIFIGFHQNTNDKFTSSCWFLLHFSVTVFISHMKILKLHRANLPENANVDWKGLPHTYNYVHIKHYQTYITVLRFYRVLRECVAYTCTF